MRFPEPEGKEYCKSDFVKSCCKVVNNKPKKSSLIKHVAKCKRQSGVYSDKSTQTQPNN